MLEQNITSIAVPAGRNGNTGRLSVMLYLKFKTDGSTSNLEAFPDFKRWPEKRLQISVFVKSNNIVSEISSRNVTNISPDVRVWEAIFPASKSIDDFNFSDFSSKRVRTNSLSRINDFIQKSYKKSASNLDWAQGNGKWEDYTDIFMPAMVKRIDFRPGIQSDHGAAADNNLRIITRKIGESFRAKKFLDEKLLEESERERAAFVNFDDFHKAKQAAAPGPTPGIPTYDIHRILALLTEYPFLLRKCMLLVDLEVSFENIDISPDSEMWAVPRWQSTFSGRTNILTPHTHISPLNWAIPNEEYDDPVMSSGWLGLSNSSLYTYSQFDGDSAALRLLSTSLNVYHSSRYHSENVKKHGLPALKSTGPSFYSKGTAESLVKSFEKSKKISESLENEEVTHLYQEDLTYGNRVEVKQEGNDRWFPLNLRLGTYTFPNDTSLRLDHTDEGRIIPAITEEGDGPGEEVKSSEKMFEFNNWLLNVPCPINILDLENRPRPYEKTSAEDKKNNFVVNFEAVEQSCPRLRFGEEIMFRCPITDLAGNSAAVSSNNATMSDKITYLRAEPLPPPEIIYSNKDETNLSRLSHLVIRGSNAKSDDNIGSLESIEPSERHIAPPSITTRFAELCGSLDHEQGLKENAYDILLSHQGSIYDKREGVEIITKLEDGKKITFPVHNTPFVNINYLPDQYCKGVVFIQLPGSEQGKETILSSAGAELNNLIPLTKNNTITKVLFETENWPNELSFKLILKPFEPPILPGKKKPLEWNEQNRSLTVFLAPADEAIVDMGCYNDEQGQLENLLLYSWIMEELKNDPEGREKMLSLMKRGGHNMLFPKREIKLCYYVKYPLGKMQLKLEAPKRQAGWSHALLSGKAIFYKRSVSEIILTAKWTEVVDYISKPGPTEEKHEEFCFKLNKENFKLSGDKTLLGKIEMDNELFEDMRHELGDHKHKMIRYYFTAVTAHPEVFSEFDKKELTRVSEELELNIPATVSPDVPEIAYCIPSHRIEKKVISEAMKTEVTVDYIPLISVYCKRPWHGTGNEYLGVITASKRLEWPPPATGGEVQISNVPKDIQDYVTLYGADPITDMSKYKMRFFGPNVNNADRVEREIIPVELKESESLRNGWVLGVAGHEVHYDESKRLWRATIEIETPPIYNMFCKIAFCRYQPFAVKDEDGADLKVSKIIQYPLQLRSKRTITVTRSMMVLEAQPTDEKEYEVKLLGAKGVIGDTENKIEVLLQKRQKNSENELDWLLKPVGGTVEILRSSGRLKEGEIWKGKVSIPKTDTNDYRVLFEENEMDNGREKLNFIGSILLDN